MKTRILFLLALSTLFFIAYGCKDEAENDKPLVFSGKLVSHTECKPLFSDSTINIPDSLSCAEYSYSSTTNKLLIKHINAGFNCCPDSIYSNVSISNDTIIIQEFESNPQCYCLCRYDLDFEIDGVSTKKYQVKFIEPLRGNQQELIFGVDFSILSTGNYCVTRHNHPWGQ
jgi:hypothetical protein